MAFLSIIAPIFGIIAVGFFAGRSRYLSARAGGGIADFAFKIAIPALLFRTILVAKFDTVDPLAVLTSFFGAAAVVWLLCTFTAYAVLKRPPQDAPAIAMCSVFGNTIMLGLPIGVATFGQESLGPISTILGVHAPVFLVTATLHDAVVTNRDGEHERLATALKAVVQQLVRQPILIAIVAATLWRTLGIPVPDPLTTLIEMLAKAGVPAALIALGLTLQTGNQIDPLSEDLPAVDRAVARNDTTILAFMLVMKLILMPAIAGLIAVAVFELPKAAASVIVLMAALPAGANAYLFTVKSGNITHAASRSVAWGTAISALTLAALIGATAPRL
jgi:malonate transporter and related proteins